MKGPFFQSAKGIARLGSLPPLQPVGSERHISEGPVIGLIYSYDMADRLGVCLFADVHNYGMLLVLYGEQAIRHQPFALTGQIIRPYVPHVQAALLESAQSFAEEIRVSPTLWKERAFPSHTGRLESEEGRTYERQARHHTRKPVHGNPMRDASVDPFGS